MSEVLTNGSPKSWGGLGDIPLLTSKASIGEGAFGEVYMWNNDGILMAVKRIQLVADIEGKTDIEREKDIEKKTDIERETDIVFRHKHRHIIQCYGVHRDANYVYIVSDYAEGGNLREAVPRLDWDNKKRIVAEVALGLAYLHSQRIIHRDIKGANILLTKHDEVKLCDFGLAKVMASAICTTTFKPRGTPKWMAPELTTGTPKYSKKSDIFALGVVMQELVNGGDAPLNYKAIMTRCLDIDPEKRPTTEEIINAFQPITQVHATAAGGGQAKAEQDISANCEYEMGLKYLEGEGVDVNLAEAAEKFRSAASMGHVEGQYRLGVMYHRGEGILRDYAKAVEMFQRAAHQGYAPAQTILGRLYNVGGDGLPQDYKKALSFFQAAANQGCSEASCNLGTMYSKGRGVVQNSVEAEKWYIEAAERGNASAQLILGVHYAESGVELNYPKAVRFLEMAGGQGNVDAMYYIGRMYAEGIAGAPKDHTIALKFWEFAAKRGQREAQYELGRMYFEGTGVRQNASTARNWFKKAAEQGSEGAQLYFEAQRLSMT
ncbi:kinase-like domain-containing protein [Dissophora ornata]|nr:kinase-like domain-containing protein [Dissophora ornata]